MSRVQIPEAAFCHYISVRDFAAGKWIALRSRVVHTHRVHADTPSSQTERHEMDCIALASCAHTPRTRRPYWRPSSESPTGQPGGRADGLGQQPYNDPSATVAGLTRRTGDRPMAGRRFLMNAGRTTKQGQLINVGKDDAAYQAIVNTLTMNPEDMKAIGIPAGGTVLRRSECGAAGFSC